MQHLLFLSHKAAGFIGLHKFWMCMPKAALEGFSESVQSFAQKTNDLADVFIENNHGVIMISVT